jgi:putative PIG3 family NAD(P)H quinone oxidoreductase
MRVTLPSGTGAVPVTVSVVRAVVITRPGPPDVLQIQDVPDPEAGPGEVLVDVAATAVNRADLMQRAGHYDPPPGASAYPGLECSGTIAALGAGVTGWSVGDQVCALLSGGGYAQQVAVPAGQLMRVPDGITLRDAAALPETACTVWSMVFDLGRLQPGETFLVHGGTSGIGTLAIQLAHRHGARVLTTVGSAAKQDAARRLGADLAINYRAQDFAEVVAAEVPGGVDLILDNMGAAYLPRNVASLATDGRLVVLGLQGGRTGELDLGALLTRRASVQAASLRARPLGQKAAIVTATEGFVWPLIEAGQVAPVIDQVLPLEQAAAAHAAVEASGHIGKVLLQVD